MYSVIVRRHVMLAHSLPDPAFGSAQRLHGATYVVDAEFQSAQLNALNIVIDIDLAGRVLDAVLDPLRYQNLDDLPQFSGIITTTEYLCSYFHREIGKALHHKFEGTLKITLGESHIAWASYEAPLSY